MSKGMTVKELAQIRKDFAATKVCTCEKFCPSSVNGPLCGVCDGNPRPPNKEATRFECGVRFDLLTPEFQKAMAEIMCVGAKKYGERNWQKGLTGENGGINHALKHIAEYQANVPNDYGAKRMHLAQAAVNLMFEFYFDEQANG